MKKVLGIIFAIFLCLCVSGCGKNVKELECDFSGENDYSNAEVKLKATFSGNEVVKISTESVYKVKDEYLNEISTYAAIQKQQYDIKDETNVDGIKFEVTNDNENIYVNLNYDLRAMSDETKEKYNMTEVYGDFDATKSSLESVGYSCK